MFQPTERQHPTKNTNRRPKSAGHRPACCRVRSPKALAFNYELLLLVGILVPITAALLQRLEDGSAESIGLCLFQNRHVIVRWQVAERGVPCRKGGTGASPKVDFKPRVCVGGVGIFGAESDAVKGPHLVRASRPIRPPSGEELLKYI